jgi:ABC-2 type transport system permease protein
MNSWSHIKTITKRELTAYFTSPVAYVVLIVFLLVSAGLPFLFAGLLERGQANLEPFFTFQPWLMLLLVPAIGMRLWSEEHRLGTLELLLTLPITAWQAIVAKFLASWIFIGIALAMTFPAWITINYLGHPDNGAVFCGYVGNWLMAGSYLAITSMTSAMTRNQVISLVSAVSLCLASVLCGFEPVPRFVAEHLGSGLANLVSGLSSLTHFQNAQRGVIDSRDLLFFLSVIGFSLFTTGVVLRSQRAG